MTVGLEGAHVAEAPKDAIPHDRQEVLVFRKSGSRTATIETFRSLQAAKGKLADITYTCLHASL